MNASLIHRGSRRRSRSARGAALIIVLWISFGLVSLALYFAHSNSLALKAADQRSAGLAAQQAIEGATRYASYLLANLEEPGRLPEVQTFLREAVSIGDGTFWFVGRDPREANPTTPYFTLVDEASRLNLNTVTRAMLEALPNMTPELVAAILDWRDGDSDVREYGAEDETYLRLNPPYRCKNAAFESLDELRLVHGMTLEALYGEDANRNGVLDANENDGTLTLPYDNRDGHLDPGFIEYFTVYSQEPATLTNGTARINITGNGATQRVASLLREQLGTDRANAVLRQAGQGNATFQSPLEFYLRSGMTADEFALIARNLSISNGVVTGLVNVNTASEAVLVCIPGIGTDYAAPLIAYRQSNPTRLNSIAWVAEVLPRQNAIRAGRYLTAYGYQYTADIAATGPLGRGFRRVQVVLDASVNPPRIRYRQDLSHLGWCLGASARERLTAASLSRTLR